MTVGVALYATMGVVIGVGVVSALPREVRRATPLWALALMFVTNAVIWPLPCWLCVRQVTRKKGM